MAFTDDQIQAINAAPNTPDTGPMFGNPQGPGISSWWGGRGVGGPAGNLTGFGGFTPPEPPSLWNKLLSTVGDLGKDLKPATPSGPTPMGAPPPPMMPTQTQPRPPGMGAYFQALQNPPATGGGGLMAQYLALQQLMGR